MYPMSKSKSSFRIADILHQQQTDSHLLAQHLMMKNGHAFHSSDFKNDLKFRSDESNGKHLNDLTDSPSPDTSSSLPPEAASSPNHHSSTNNSNSERGNGGGGGGGGKSDFPMKPTPMYSNFQLPFPLGIHPAFHPAAAYLNYADVIHKASSSRMWPFYHPYSNYFMPPCGSKRKGGQVRFTPQQTQNLERRFSNHKYLSPEDRRKLALELSLSDRQVKTWFQNRRAKWRRANNATGTSSNHSGGNQSSTNGDNVSSSDDEEDDEIAQRPLQMYLHHQQYYKQMKEIQKQQKEAATTARPENARTNSGSDKNDEDDVDVN